MSAIVPKEGRTALLHWLTLTGLGSAAVGLAANDLTPDADTVFADVVEPEWGGYAQQPSGPWSDPTPLPDGTSQVTASPVSFTMTDPGSAEVYCWFLKDTNGKLLAIERFAGAPVAVTSGQPFPLTLLYRDTQS